MNVEIGTEAAQFPEKEYINGIFLAVQLFLYEGKTQIGYFEWVFEGGKAFLTPKLAQALPLPPLPLFRHFTFPL